MATENLTVVHRKVPTAYFDLKNRLLCCPILKDDISPELYDLFMGHEVSHALHTPYEGVHSAVTKNKTLKGYLNVIEDVRIERIIKNKYPGLRKSFYTAYNELMDMDFFGVKGRDLTKECSLIDKINLITKCGSRVSITLTKEEQFFLDWAMKCETWEQVEECATAIYEWSKENETRTEVDEQLVPQMFDIGDDEEDEDGDEEDFEDSDESWGESYEDNEEEQEEDSLPEIESEEDGEEEAESTGEEETEEESEENKPTGSVAGKGGSATPDQFDDEDGARESITEHNAHNNEEQFISDENFIKYQIDLTKKFKKNDYFKDMVYSYKDVMKDMNKYYNNTEEDSYDNDYKVSTLNRARHTARKLERKNKAIVMHMAKEFEMRQTAQRAVHAFTGKTGKLDMNRLAKYQIVDDVFKRTTLMPDGQNHGVNILVDWSGSICNEVQDILEQTIILTMFCRKVNIPHRVYLFSDRISARNDYDWDNDTSKMIEIFSNEMSSRDYKEMLVNVCAFYNHFYTQYLNTWGRGWEKKVQRYDDWFKGCQDPIYKEDGWTSVPSDVIPHKYNLGGTPLDASIVGMRTHLRDFIKKYSIEKSILTVITDGYSHSAECLKKDNDEREAELEQLGDEDRWNVKRIREIIDPYSRKVYPLQETSGDWGRMDFKVTQNLLHWLGKETNTTITGYFICSRKQDATQLFQLVDDSYYNTAWYDQNWKDARKGGCVIEAHGYNKLFVAAASKIGVEGSDELDDELVDAKKSRIMSAFKKNQKSKTTSRFLTNEFIKEIA